MEDEERRKKLEAGKAKLAQFRQRKAQSDGQNASKKQKKKKKASNTKDEESVQDGPDIDPSQGDETSTHSSQRGATATADFAIMRTLRDGEIIKHDQIYTIEPDSEISTTADDYSSEEEEFGVGETYSEHEMQHSQTRLEMMENELAGKQQEIEELNREIEEMRAAYGTEGLQQLQEFEAAIKQRDDIITQLTTNLQQARKEKDETLREFLELTEQSQKLQIQFQHASEALRNTSHSSTAADLLQAKQQILTHQQQLEEQEYLLKNYQKKNEEFEAQITLLQDRLTVYEMAKYGEDSNKKLQEKEALIGELKAKITKEEKNAFQMKEKLSNANKSLQELKEHIVQTNQEANNLRLELANCKQKERQCSDEIKQLMGTVEELQKRCHKDSQFETDVIQRMELETQRKLAQLQAELDELYGQQIVQMKQELTKQHALKTEELLAQQKIELEKNLNPCSHDNINEDQVHLMNIAINELTVKLQDANYQKEKIKQDLSQQLEEISAEKSRQQTQIEDLFQELTFASEQIQRAKKTIVDKECQLNEANKYQVIIEDLKAQLASAFMLRKELELKHEAEVTNYKIKLEMLEREKDEVLDRMAESQEAELERLRTQLLFSHEEELSKLREDLQQEHRINIENLKGNLATHYKQQLEGVQNEMSQKIEAMQFEKDNLIMTQSQLILEISKLKDFQQSVVNSKSEEMTLQIQELQKEIDVLRQEEKEKGTLEQEVQELQLKTELLEKQLKEKEDSLQKKCTKLETQNNILKDENRALEEKLKHISVNSENKLIFTGHVSSKSEDPDMQKRIEKLTAENEQLIKQDIELKAEIERQKNTFSFAEKKFEASYQELQKEYACLLKAKGDLEESKNKEEAEYKIKLRALTEELQHLRSYKQDVLKTKSTVPEGSKEDKICRADTFEVGEVVEKDTTELMEKLEVAQREKVELSLRLSDLSEQLKLKHGEICLLSEEVKSLKQEKEQVLARCKELEVISHNQTENVNIFEQNAKHAKEKAQTEAIPVSETRNLIFGPSSELNEKIKVREDNLSLCKDADHRVTEKEIQQKMNPEQQSLLNHLHQMTDKVAGETSLLAITQHENGQLQQQLDILKSEQADLRLQMEAQRICLSLVYSAHVDQVREYLKAEKENALCSLKEELICRHAQEMNELKKMHQQELETLKGQQAGDEDKSTLMLIEKLSKAVSEECVSLTQVLYSVQHEQHSTPIEVSAGKQDVYHASLVERKEPNIELPTHRIQAQALQESMQALLSKIREEYNRLIVLHSQFMKDCKKIEEQQISCVELECRNEESSCLQMKIEGFQTPSQELIDLMVRASRWEEMENLKIQLEGQHAQEIEHLRSYFQQQLKETEERYTTEVVHLQNRLQDVTQSPEHFSISAESQQNSKDVMQKMTQTESFYEQRPERVIESPSEMESKGDNDIIQLLDKQYQGRLEEEIAKVIVSMSVAFAQQTELARMARQKEESELSVAQAQIVHQKEKHSESRKKFTDDELDSYLIKEKKVEIKHAEESKPLSKELNEESSEISSLEEQLESSVKPVYILEQSKCEMGFPVKLLSQGKELTPCHEIATSSETSGQLLLYEERLEDMRQELVRQYQEHQQATELLKRGHMQQMERQKENQEQLLAELHRLKTQLAESVSVENDNLVTERERMLLKELELLKQHPVPGREKLHCELCNNSTQTQNENESQIKSKEYTFEDEDGDRKTEEISSDSLSKERHSLQKANDRLLKILLEVVKTTVAVEETIGHHVLGLLERSGKSPLSKTDLWEMEAEQSLNTMNEFHGEEPFSSYHGTNLGDEATSRWSEVTEEGLRLTQDLTESGFVGAELDPDNEELILDISSRLQAAVEKLLEAINETSNQLEHAKVTQTELLRESFRKQQEATEFFKYQEELQERLNEEVRVREQMALELSKVEGLIDGYADEKAFLEKQIQEKIDIIDHLEQELLCTGNKLQELEAEQQQIQEEKELLSRQKDAMKADAGPVEQRIVDAAVDAASQAELLEETEKLMKEKIEVQRQAEKEYDDLQKQVKALETDLEEQVNRFMELEQERNAELMDLRQQNQALEKQLEKTRKFLDEQAIDREHERDVFQQEIQKLEQQLKTPQRFQPINEHQTREVEQLTNHLQEKTDKCSELLLSKEQLQRDIQERNEEIEKLEGRIRELEQALIISADNLQKVKERKQCGAATMKGELPLEEQLQAEKEAVDRKEKEITNLEEQLEQFREELENKNEEVQQLHMQLEIQRKESTTRLQELEQENKLFKDEMERLGLVIQKSEDASIKDRCLVAGKLAQIMQEKEQEIDHLNEQIATMQQQLESTTDNKVIEEKNEHIRELEAQTECLKSDQERVKKNNEEEIEQLNEVIEKLQQELANIEQKVPVDVTSIQEDADSLKQQFDTVLAEKEALEKKMEDDNVKASLTKNELEETKLKMNHLKKELDILKREHEQVSEKYKHLLMESDKAEVGDRSKDKSEKLEEAVNEKTPTLLENKIQLTSVEENTKVTISNMEINLQQLQAVIKERDSELCQCYNQMKDLKEQAKVETQVLRKKILELEKLLQEKVAAALVSQVQLNAVQEQNKLRQRTKAFSNKEANKSTQTENPKHVAKEETKSKLSILTEKLSEMENELEGMYSKLKLEKENAEIAQKEVIKKEHRLLELQQLLEDIEEKHKEEIKKTPKQGEVQISEVVTELTQGQEGNVLIAEHELEKIKAESAAAKEELSSYREKSEKLQEQLMVRETSMTHLQEELHQVKDNLCEAEKKLADYMRKEAKIAELEGIKDVDKPDSVSTKEDPSFTRKSSSSQTDKTMQISSSNQTLQVAVKNAEIQNDLQNESSSEEVAEIIREFSERTDQMQELHAAEIMDMETRHISESEALKREQFVAVQILTDECNALKEVIETLRAKEAIPISGLPHSGSYQARDGCSSDSSSDWSQGIYLTQSQGSDTVSEGIGEEDETSTDLLPKKIKGLLRAVHQEGVQVLSLTEFPDSERDIMSIKQGPELWLEERKSFLITISSLKDLIRQMQLHRETEIYANCESPESVPDWRGELLHAVQQVFLTEQDVLLAAFQTELAELGTKDAVVLMNQLEHRLQEQVINQRVAMDFIQNADRRSLLMEIQVLHTQMNNRKINPKREQEIDPKSQEMLEYNVQQKQSQMLEMQVELRSVKDRAAELQEQLNSERMMVSELKNECAQAKLELETTLKAQHKHFKDLETIRTEVKEKAAELDKLKDTMANEQKKSRELQWALEKEKAKMERSEERGREELEDLKFSLEDQNQKNLQLNRLLEQEKQLSNELQRKIESQEVLNAAQLSQEQARNSELQVLLESEKVRVLEMSSALERGKELCAQLQRVEDKGQDGTLRTTEELLKDLQKQMDEKHDRIVELVSEMERYKLESVQLKQQMEKERQIQKKTIQTEQDAAILAQKKVHELESKVEDLQGQLGEKRQQVHKLQHEARKLQEIIQELQKREEKDAEKAMCPNLNETSWDTSNERTRNWVLQQKMEGAEMNESTYPTLTGVKGEGDLGDGSKILETVRQKLQNVSSELKQLAHKAASRLQFETADDDNFIGVQNNIEDALLLLGTLPGLSQLEEMKLVLPPGASSSSLTEGLLRQNAELLGLVSRLSEEKNNMRNVVMKLEEEFRRYRQRGPCGDYSSRCSLDNGANIDTLSTSEREIWNREKLLLQKSLKQADAELSKLRAELRSEAFLRDLGSNSENAVLKLKAALHYGAGIQRPLALVQAPPWQQKIIYGKFLRAESFRKALIYQKKYLLLLVGGFQECEEATLALIARMGGQPSYADLEIITHRSKGFTRFRSLVRVSIAISRMKFLVRRWHRVTSSNLISVNRGGFSQNTGNELRPDSLAGGLELYGEHRHSSDRSRSDLESLKSPVNSQHRYQGTHADLSPASLACPQLHNYDPDRALTDYINRLEALQRRLGSVQSGSASYIHLHAGVRR